MLYTGTLHGRKVHYKDQGYNAGQWFYTSTFKENQDRKIEMEIALQDDDDQGECYSQRVKNAWREAYQHCPMVKVEINDVPDIIPDPVKRSKQGDRHWSWYTKENHP